VYKLLLCWRYLRTRYLALACIVSVMLGVATLIVVNSVMGGFSTKLKDRLHRLLSDVVVEAQTFDGFADPKGKMELIRSAVGDKVEAMAPELEAFALLQFRVGAEMNTRVVRLIGIDPEARSRLGGFAEFLTERKNQPHPSFDLPRDARERSDLRNASERFQISMLPATAPPGEPPLDPTPTVVRVPQWVVLGRAIAYFRYKDARTDPPQLKEACALPVGSEVVLTTLSGAKMAPVYDSFVVCDYFMSDMSEYDANLVFVPLEHLQILRGMEDRATSIQIKLKDYRDAPEVVAKLRQLFPYGLYQVSTWEEKQGALLAAIGVERGILNILLFLIIAVAGFGILAIFAMIVVEKTRDIGILKALGASNGGVMRIFLGYGLLLGLVGAGLGTALGLSITVNINGIEHLLSRLTGQDIFPRDVYYFDKIPTDIQTWMIVFVDLGAVGIAVLASVLPALKAALLHPVRALRYE
jgi:lipoprotein-releasing system permease protein